MNILVLGKTGQLGKSIHELVLSSLQKHNFVFVGREELDLNQNKSINSFFNGRHFDVVINCAAYTKVDSAEDESKLANQINHLAVSKLADIAKKQGFKIIHISTDYVFDGKSTKAYKEGDKPNPLNSYGQTKLDGERAIQRILTHDSIIIRTSGLYSNFGENFVSKIIDISKTNTEIEVVSDQIVSPTYAADLAEVIVTIINSKKFYIQNQKTQIYHFCANEALSWFEFAQTIFKHAKIKIKINPCDSNEFTSKVKRPNYSVMHTGKIKNDYDVSDFSVSDSIERLFESKLNKNKFDI